MLSMLSFFSPDLQMDFGSFSLRYLFAHVYFNSSSLPFFLTWQQLVNCLDYLADIIQNRLLEDLVLNTKNRATCFDREIN